MSQCLLFTDLDNPISNAIYARIGDRPCLDVRELRFGHTGSVSRLTGEKSSAKRHTP